MSHTMEEYVQFVRNRRNFDHDMLLSHAGTWVAFNKEGTEIVLTSAASQEDLWERLEGLGLDPSDHPTEYVIGPDDVIERGIFVSRGNPGATDAPVTGAAQHRSAE